MIRYLTAGESHGTALVGIVEGIPAGISIATEYIHNQLSRRQQGYGRGARMRIEQDEVEIVSGVRFGKTLGSPIALRIRNADHESWTSTMAVEGDGSGVEPVTIPRPGHADFAASVKYGFTDVRNAIERASARETAMRVACCTVIRKLLEEVGIFTGSHVLSIGSASIRDRTPIDRRIARLAARASCAAYKVTEEADKSPVRMLDAAAEARAVSEIKRATKAGDTLGGVFEIIVTGVPVGLGSHVHFDRKLDGQLAQALMSVHAVKGVEIGDAFELARRPGSAVHDAFQIHGDEIRRATNRAGGLEGGVSNGEHIVLHAAMKPIATLAHPLLSVDLRTNRVLPARYERSDVCAVPAASVICEAVIQPVLANAYLEKFGGDSIDEVRAHRPPLRSVRKSSR